MNRRIITFKGYFEKFLLSLTEKEVKKMEYLISLLETEDGYRSNS